MRESFFTFDKPMKFNPSTHIPVMEHFYTIQGEGFYTGHAAYFIRLAGCDVGCVWCDVKESWTVEEKQLMLIDDLLHEVLKHPELIRYQESWIGFAFLRRNLKHL